MQFSTIVLSALSIGSALAKGSSSSSSAAASVSTGTPSGSVKVHVVKVGSSNGTLRYSPENLVAAKGDMVQFQFAPANHTVTQSNFDNPCQPIAMHTNNTGFFSGFMPVSAAATTTPTYTIMVMSTTPMWVYCSQGKHCQNGMSMVINENTGANATRSLANYKALAKLATVSLPGGSIMGGSSSSSSSGSSSTNGTSTNAGSDSSSGTASSSASSSSETASSGSGTGSGSAGSGSGTDSSSTTAASGAGGAAATGTTDGSSSTTSAPAKTTANAASNIVSSGSSLGLGAAIAMAVALVF